MALLHAVGAAVSSEVATSKPIIPQSTACGLQSGRWVASGADTLEAACLPALLSGQNEHLALRRTACQ